jgi:short-subunit dehydrogenase
VDDDQARPLAVVTGAGRPGRELVALYARDGFDLALVARRAGLLHALADELQRAHGVRCLVFPADLASAGAVASVLAALEPHRHQVRALVNNAGFGNVGWFHDIPAERHRALLEVNVAALTQLTHGVLPWLLHGGRGHVMNVASVAAFQPGPVMATYYAQGVRPLALGGPA